MSNYRMPINGIPSRMRSPFLASFSAGTFTPPPISTDIQLLLHGEDFLDSSSFNRTVTLIESPIIDTSDPKIGAGCFLFSGSDLGGTEDGLSVNGILFEDKDFTIEFWIKPSQLGVNRMLIKEPTIETSTSLFIRIHSDNRVVAGFRTEYTSFFITLTSTSTLPNTEYTHIALVRNDDTLKLFVNGVNENTGMGLSGYFYYTEGYPLFIGCNYFADSESFDYSLNGKMDEICISFVAKYDSNFTPSLEPIS